MELLETTPFSTSMLITAGSLVTPTSALTPLQQTNKFAENKRMTSIRVGFNIPSNS